MVALFGFLHPCEKFFHFGFFVESGAVNSRQHFFAAVSAPIRARNARKPERFELACGRKVGTPAHIGKFALSKECDSFVLYSFEQLQLVRLVSQHFLRALNGNDGFFDGKIRFDDFVHFLLDSLEIVEGYRPRKIYIVIKTSFDGGTDCQFRIGIKTLDCLRQNVACSVSVNLLSFLVLES